jgi:ankyrin repeat protein
MSNSSAEHAAPCNETDFHSYSTLKLKPLLQFVTAECLTSLPASDLNIVDFVVQLLQSNREFLLQACAGSSGLKNLSKRSSQADVHRLQRLECEASSVRDPEQQVDVKEIIPVDFSVKEEGDEVKSSDISKDKDETTRNVDKSLIHAYIDSSLMNMFRSVPVTEVLGAATLRIAPSIFESGDSLRSFASLGEKTLTSIAEASSLELAKELLRQTQKLRQGYEALDALAKLKADDGGSKFSGTSLIVGTAKDFHDSLYGRLGQGPSLEFEKAMRAEHCERADSLVEFTTSNYSLRTTPALEWNYAVEGVQPPPGHFLNKEGRAVRKIRSIEELMKLDIVIKAGLERAEVISVSLYTGPMYMKYNPCLREGKSAGRNMFATTIFVLVSAVQKIAKVTNISEDLVLYCGLGSVSDLPECFRCRDEFGSIGWTEFGFRSTTAEKSVALDYSGIKKGNPHPRVMAIRPNSIDRAACIQDLSQYEGEKEYLFVPCSFLQPNGPSFLELVSQGVVEVVPVRLNANLKTETLNELRDKKKRLHLASADALVEEVRNALDVWASSKEAANRLNEDLSRSDCTPATLSAKIVEDCYAVMKRHGDTKTEDYASNEHFRGMVSEMLDTIEWAMEMKDLWMQDQSRKISNLQDKKSTLRDCHRLWQAFLRARITGTADKAPDVVSAISFLNSRGYLQRGVDEKNSDGEALMVQAGADGWNKADILAAAFAGAKVDACTSSGGMSGLFLAARYGHLESVTALLEVKANANQCNFEGASPIYVAAAHGYSDIISRLVSSNGDVTISKPKDGVCPLIKAVQEDQSHVIAQLISFNSNVDKCMKDGRSALYLAVESGATLCVAQLLAQKADPRSSWNGLSALDLARQKERLECVRLLEDALQ